MGQKRLVFCDHDGSDVDFQVLDNDADYEELVRGEHTNYDVAFSDSYPFDFSTIEFTRGFSNNMDRRLATDWDCHATHNGIKYPTNSHVEDDNTPGPGELGSVKIYGYYMGDDITVKCVDDDGWLGGEDNIGSAHITSDDIYPNGNDALYLSLNGNNFIYVKVG